MFRSKKFKSSYLLLAITLVPAVGDAQTLPPAPEIVPVIATPTDARLVGLESLRTALSSDGGAPLPPNLSDFVRNKQAAIRLGKALFWDMNMGSDGVQACATCHFTAGVDNRARNVVNPDLLRVKSVRDGDIKGYSSAPTAADPLFTRGGASSLLQASDYPFVKAVESVVLNLDGTVGPGAGNSNDITSSMGVFYTLFQGTSRNSTTLDQGRRLLDPVFNVHGSTTRRVEPRNTPTMINAVLNYVNFWDGRANNTFNGANPFGPQDSTAGVFVLQSNGGIAKEKIALVNASLASQAVGPPLSPFEMSFGAPELGNARTFAELGKKLLRGDPAALNRQLVDSKDSVLGPITAYPKRGLNANYRQLISLAFEPKYWDYKGTLLLTRTTLAKKTTAGDPTVQCSFTVLPPTPGILQFAPKVDGAFTQMEANFALFVGLSIMLYESTLVSDQTPFDSWMESGALNDRFDANALSGLNLFVGKGHCINCHGGPELSNASVRNAERGKNVIEPMLMADGPALYDNGFYNIGTVPTTDDLGRGGQDLNGRPLAFSRQSLFRRVLGIDIPFPITGDDSIPALDVDGNVVCADANENGFCDPAELLSTDFKRAAVDGAFKTPGLRNQELMAPYMHNGGFATLRQVVEFYNRGGNFCRTNQADLDPDIEPRAMTPSELDTLVGFLLSLTDQRVRLEQGPFDHPELFIPITGTAEASSGPKDMQRLPQIGQAGIDAKNKQPGFLSLNPRESLFTPAGVCQ